MGVLVHSSPQPDASRRVLLVLPSLALVLVTVGVLFASPRGHYGLLLAVVPLLAAAVHTVHATVFLGALTVAVYAALHRARADAWDVWTIKLGLVAGVCLVGVLLAQARSRERRLNVTEDVALALQRELLPRAVPALPAVEVCHRYVPADSSAGVGGDWFDVIPLSGSRVALVIGDVVGHGVQAAALMGRLRTAVHTLADLDLAPAELLARMNDLLIRLGEEDPEREPGATLLFLVYDPVSGGCTIGGAGHAPAAFLTTDGSVEFPRLPETPPLGIPGTVFEDTEFHLDPGTVIALYTDGLLDLRAQGADDALAGLGGALAASAAGAPLDQLCERVCAATLGFGGNDDDVALLLARTRRLSEDRVANWELRADVQAAAHARALVSEQLRLWGLERLVFSTELIVSELVTNAVRYAVSPVTLRLIRSQVLICEVSDGTNASPHVRRAHSTDEGGRGLFLVSQVSDRWGTRHHRDGKTIWVEQYLPSVPQSQHTVWPRGVPTSARPVLP
ncbi:SpoIIE family protein phosphatase [Streptomyces sp. NPDC101225]|uniref:ATP-binding SpoIIE family protein phosphatase n=1 Tax=Streptomyces sp. NPDC101225 TaxID=3366135 RepID=UPI0037F3F2C6